jgi:hypothetical protein
VAQAYWFVFLFLQIYDFKEPNLQLIQKESKTFGALLSF